MFDTGLIIGRFQIFHKGHELVVRKALELCHHVVIYIGSADKSRTKLNPFTYEERKQMLNFVFGKEIRLGIISVRPLPDIGVGDNTNWGKYVLETFLHDFKNLPDLSISGIEKERPSWFDSKVAPNMSELRLSKQAIYSSEYKPVSATYCRELLLADNKLAFESCVPAGIFTLYNILRDILVEVNK